MQGQGKTLPVLGLVHYSTLRLRHLLTQGQAQATTMIFSIFVILLHLRRLLCVTVFVLRDCDFLFCGNHL